MKLCSVSFSLIFIFSFVIYIFIWYLKQLLVFLINTPLCIDLYVYINFVIIQSKVQDIVQDRLDYLRPDYLMGNFLILHSLW